jgi:hypothetical protein
MDLPRPHNLSNIGRANMGTKWGDCTRWAYVLKVNLVNRLTFDNLADLRGEGC